MNRATKTAIAAAAVMAVGAVAFNAFALDRITKQLSWDGAPDLEISVPGQVTFTQGPRVQVVVSGQKADVDRVYISGHSIRFDRKWTWWGSYRSARDLRVTISAPHLNRLAVHSGTNISIPDLREENLSLSVHSGADAKVNTTVRSLSAKVHSGADLHVSGRTENLDLTVHSGADADMRGLAVDNARVSAHSGGDAKINARVSVNAEAHSGGDIRLMNRPAQVQVSRHSGGGVYIP